MPVFINGVAQIGDMFKATYDPDEDGRIEKEAMDWDVNKILEGAGDGVNPTLIDVPTSRTIATGSYTGSGSNNRQITTGFKCSLVLLYRNESTAAMQWFCLTTTRVIRVENSGDVVYDGADCLLHATDGFIVDFQDANVGSDDYRYWAISE